MLLGIAMWLLKLSNKVLDDSVFGLQKFGYQMIRHLKAMRNRKKNSYETEKCIIYWTGNHYEFHESFLSTIVPFWPLIYQLKILAKSDRCDACGHRQTCQKRLASESHRHLGPIFEWPILSCGPPKWPKRHFQPLLASTAWGVNLNS